MTIWAVEAGVNRVPLFRVGYIAASRVSYNQTGKAIGEGERQSGDLSERLKGCYGINQIHFCHIMPYYSHSNMPTSKGVIILSYNNSWWWFSHFNSVYGAAIVLGSIGDESAIVLLPVDCHRNEHNLEFPKLRRKYGGQARPHWGATKQRFQESEL